MKCYILSFNFLKFKICHVILDPKVDQWISKQGWKDNGDGFVFVANQEDTIKPKNIQEKITFDSKLTIYSCLYELG